MLGRHGDNLFWMARYLERSENLSRRIQATLHYALSREDEGEEDVASPGGLPAERAAGQHFAGGGAVADGARRMAQAAA